MKKILALFAVAALFSQTSFAQSTTSKTPATSPKPRKKATKAQNQESPTYRYRYGMAGCGLGSLVFSKPAHQEDRMIQIVAATLNATGYQTVGITSGTSNCNQPPPEVARMEQEVFVTNNLSSLEKEAAKGEGEHLIAFANVLGCDSEGNTFADLSREHFQRIFADSNPKAVLDRYVTEIHANPALSKSCTRVML